MKLGATPAAPAPALVVAHINVLEPHGDAASRRSARAGPLWPNDTYSTPYKDFFFNNEAVIVTNLPAAHHRWR